MKVVLGGGIGGLTATHYLLDAFGRNVTLVEGSSKLGGWIRSVQDPKTGLIFEQGPHTIRPTKEIGMNTLALVEELGLADKVIPISAYHPTATNRLIYVNGNLFKLPSKALDVFKIIPPFSKPLLFGLFKDLFAPKKVCSDESIYDFVNRRLGNELAEYGISPMICGICAGNAKEISVKLVMKKMFEGEQRHGSIIKGMWKSNSLKKSAFSGIKSDLCEQAKLEKWSVWSLSGGLQELPDSLGFNVKRRGANVILDSLCTGIKFKDDYAVCHVGDKDLECDHVISSLPAHNLAPLICEQHPFLSQELLNIKSVSVAVVNLAYEGNVLKENAFGFLVPPSENLPILGVIFDSCSFPQEDWTVLTVMMGGHWFEHYFGQDPKPEFIFNTATSHVQDILQINQDPYVHNVSILNKCIPQYTIGHYERIDKIYEYIESNHLPLSLVGSSYDGVGINNVIMSSRKAVDAIIKSKKLL